MALIPAAAAASLASTAASRCLSALAAALRACCAAVHGCTGGGGASGFGPSARSVAAATATAQPARRAASKEASIGFASDVHTARAAAGSGWAIADAGSSCTLAAETGEASLPGGTAPSTVSLLVLLSGAPPDDLRGVEEKDLTPGSARQAREAGSVKYQHQYSLRLSCLRLEAPAAPRPADAVWM